MKPTTHDEYLAGVSAEQRAALEKLRRAIHAASPGVEECISYGVPAFRWQGRYFLAYGAGAKHCAFYPGAVVEALGAELAGYDTSKGTIRFSAEKPLPAALVRKLVRLRMARSGSLPTDRKDKVRQSPKKRTP